MAEPGSASLPVRRLDGEYTKLARERESPDDGNNRGQRVDDNAKAAPIVCKTGATRASNVAKSLALEGRWIGRTGQSHSVTATYTAALRHGRPRGHSARRDRLYARTQRRSETAHFVSRFVAPRVAQGLRVGDPVSL